jgi:hypothetical protein
VKPPTGATIASWWATLTTEQRIDAQAAVERGALPEWMAKGLRERLGDAVVTTWWAGDLGDHPAPFRTTAEVADLIAAQRP